MPSPRCLFAALLLVSFCVVNLIVVNRVPISFSILGLIYAWLLELSILALAYDMSEALLCLMLPENHLPSLSLLEHYPPVALLYVTCDDFDEEIIRSLAEQDYPNLEIFILDDSQHPESRRVVDGLGLRVVRRRSRQGYKAGNINNWLFEYGSDYVYFVIADADSMFSRDFVSRMVKVAEHHDNRELAIIESMIYAWNDHHPFVEPLASLTPFQRCRRLRLLNSMSSTFSVGHNNLCRASVLQSIGGFSEEYIGEDYATTIEVLRRAPWKCRTASVESYERAPENIAEYARRQSRWAYQTFQLCSLSTRWLSWEAKLALLRALHYYAMPIIAYMGMFWLVIFNSGYWMSFRLGQPIPRITGSFVGHPAFIFWVCWLVAPALLRWALLRREAVPLLVCIRSTFFQASLFFATTWPVISRLTEIQLRERHRFDVTGRSPAPHFVDVLKLSGPGILLAWITLLSFIPAPRQVLLNLIWLAPACLSPFIVHKSMTGRCKQ
jgi:Glycosyl transferase family group 2